MFDYKYRGIRCDNNEWIIGGLFQNYPCVTEDGLCISQVCDRDLTDYYIIDGTKSTITPVQVKKETIGLYTDAYDKNGKEAAVGDIIDIGSDLGIVKFGRYTPSNYYQKNTAIGFYIEWQEYDYIRNDIAFWLNGEKAEIIGNIYNNSDLLRREN